MVKRSVWLLGLVAFGLVLVAAPVEAQEPSGWCTLSYPGDCQVSAGGVKVHCSDVGAVPDCRAS